MPKIQLDINVASDVAIDVTNDVLVVKGMEAYPKFVIHSKSLLHIVINIK